MLLKPPPCNPSSDPRHSSYLVYKSQGRPYKILQGPLCRPRGLRGRAGPPKMQVLHSEPLLMCVMTGLWTTNRELMPVPEWLRTVLPTCRPGWGGRLLDSPHPAPAGPELGKSVTLLLPLVPPTSASLTPPAPCSRARGFADVSVNLCI